MTLKMETGTTGERKKTFSPEEVGERLVRFRDYIGGTVDLTKWVVSAEYIGGATIFKNIDTGAIVSLNIKE